MAEQQATGRAEGEPVRAAGHPPADHALDEALDDVLITHELARRPARPPDHAAEARALGALAATLAANPRGLLQAVVETAMTLCRADSAGVSILEPDGDPGGDHDGGGQDVFRWHATAGAFAPHAGATMPPAASPCGEVVRRDAVLLVDRPGRHFRAFDGVDPPIREGLLAPWHVDGAPAGTLWVIHHAPDRHFDAEDARLVASLARFAAAAWQTVGALEAAEAARAATAAELRQSEARARALVAHLPGTAAFVVDHDLRYLLAEGEALGAAGLAPEAFVGRTMHEVLGPALAAVGEPLFRRALAGETFTSEHEQGGRAFLSHGGPLRDAAGRVEAAVAVSTDVTAYREAEAALQASEARQAFLLGLSDALRPLGDPVAIQAEATRVLGEHLGVSRALYCEIEPDGGQVVVARDYVNAAPSMVGRLRLGDFGAALQREITAGRIVVDPDVLADPALSDAQRAAFGAVAVLAHISVPLVKGGRLVGALAVHQAAPRAWTPAEVALVQEVAERTWAAVERARAEAALRVREEQYRTLFESMGQGYARAEMVRDAAGRAVDVRMLDLNPAYERLMGVPAEVARGRRVYELYPAVDRWWLESYDRVVRAGVPERLEYRYTAADRWYEAWVYPRGGDQFDVLFEDVTERKAAEAAVRASDARYRTLLENVRDYAIFLLDAEGCVTEWPAGAERVTGYAAAEALGQPLARLYTPEDAAAGVPAAHLAEAAREGRGRWGGWRVRKDGSRFWANEIATAVRDGDGLLTGFTTITRDLTEQRLAEHAAEQAQRAAARDELRRALAAAEEAERRRLARELHDQLGQELTAFRLGLDEAARLTRALAAGGVDGTANPVLDRLERLQALAGRMTVGARAIALELRPPELDDIGLEGALATYVREWAARYDVSADVAVTGAVAGVAGRAIPGDVGTALYRIAQEALTNVAKHAGASRVSVVVDKPDGEVRLIVEDDGRGFDVEATAARARADRRLGLAGMRERAALVGGTVAVESTPGAGTTLYVRLPVAPHAGPTAPPAAPPRAASRAASA